MPPDTIGKWTAEESDQNACLAKICDFTEITPNLQFSEYYYQESLVAHLKWLIWEWRKGDDKEPRLDEREPELVARTTSRILSWLDSWPNMSVTTWFCRCNHVFVAAYFLARWLKLFRSERAKKLREHVFPLIHVSFYDGLAKINQIVWLQKPL